MVSGVYALMHYTALTSKIIASPYEHLQAKFSNKSLRKEKELLNPSIDLHEVTRIFHSGGSAFRIASGWDLSYFLLVGPFCGSRQKGRGSVL